MGTDNVVYEKVEKNEKNENIQPPPKPHKGFGIRHLQTLLLFLSIAVSFAHKSILSVSMVAITGHGLDTNMTCVTNSNNITSGINGNNTSTLCEHEVKSKWDVYRIYEWNKSTQEIIMFSFFVGYTAMQIPMGYIGQKFGGKIPILVALSVNGVMSILTPWILVIGGWKTLCVCRFIQGMTQGALYPCIHTLLGKWVPLSERGRLSTYVYTGSQFGTILIFQLSGVFAANPSLGWPATFWFFGILSLITFGLLAWFGASSPHEHKSISAEEVIFITDGGNSGMPSKKRKTPWKQILTSKAVWAIIVGHVGSSTGYMLVLTQIPTYMNYVLGVNIKKNGIFSSLPYLSMYCSGLVCGFVADLIVNKKILSLVNLRRVSNTIGVMVAALFMVGFCYVTNTVVAVTFITISLGLHSACHVGFHINHIDLSPNFAGTIMGVGNMFGNLMSLAIPFLVANIVRDDLTNQHKWQIVFMLIGAFETVANAIFVLFVKAEVQPWNNYEEENDSEKDIEQEEMTSKVNNIENKTIEKCN